jgi:hypothetical protein
VLEKVITAADLPTAYYPVVVLPPSYAEELKSLPSTRLSLDEAQRDRFHGDYVLLDFKLPTGKMC